MESNSTLDVSDSSPLNIPMWYHTTYSLLPPQAPRRCLSKFHALCSPLCPQLHKPPHPIALLVLSSRSLGNALIYTAAAAPTFIVIAAPPSFPPPPPPQRHHVLRSTPCTFSFYYPLPPTSPLLPHPLAYYPLLTSLLPIYKPRTVVLGSLGSVY